MSAITNVAALQAFLDERGGKSKNRLYIKNKQLQYDDNAGCMTLFAASLGFGSASISNVAKFIKKNRATLFAGENDKKLTNFNAFIVTYNDNHCCCLKTAKQIKLIAKQADVSAFNIDTLDYANKNDMHGLVKHHLANCKHLFGNNELLPTITEHCEHLGVALDIWKLLDGAITKEEKQTLNEILEFKNEVRAAFFPAKTKKLKGLDFQPKSSQGASDADKNALRAQLKGIRATVLKKYFHDRLELDGAKLAQLRLRFNENKDKGSLTETAFLAAQLDRWAKKLAEGKPIAIPKWYHCTHELKTVSLIADSHILCMKVSGYSGSFVANLPETSSYGRNCFVMSDHIEKTGTKNPRQKDPITGVKEPKATTPVYPQFSNMKSTDKIHYTDTPMVLESADFKDNQSGVGIWFGFRRGVRTIVNGWGTDGIPLQRMERIRSGNLKYYKDTTVAYVFNCDNDAGLKTIAQNRRLQVATYAQAQAMRGLINGTFFCTLPAGWKDNIVHCRD